MLRTVVIQNGSCSNTFSISFSRQTSGLNFAKNNFSSTSPDRKIAINFIYLYVRPAPNLSSAISESEKFTGETPK